MVQCSTAQITRRDKDEFYINELGSINIYRQSSLLYISYSYIMAARVLSNLTTRARSARVR